MHRQKQEPILRRLLVLAPEHDIDHALRAMDTLIEGNLVLLTHEYMVPRAEALKMLRHAWASEKQEEAAYAAVLTYLDMIGVPQEPTP